MALRFLANTVGAEAVYMECTNGSHVKTTGDQDTLVNLAWGARHLGWQSSDTGARRITYINKAGMDANHIVIAGADSLVGHTVKAAWYTSYPSTGTDLTLSLNLLGPKGTDYAEGLGALTGKEAFSLYLPDTHAKSLPKLFFSQSVTFDEGVTITREPAWAQLRLRQQVYGISEKLSLTVTGVSDATVAAFNALPALYEQPFFVYDTTSEFIIDGLVHVIMTNAPTIKAFDDFHTLSFDLFVLRYP